MVALTTKLNQDLSRPFLLMNNNFICEFGLNSWSETITTDSFLNQKLLNDMIIIDSKCRKFRVVDIAIGDIRRNLFNFFGLIRFDNFFSGKVSYKIEFILGDSENLTYEDTREYIADLVVQRRWAGQTGATPAQYRKSLEEIHDMRSLIEHIGFLGRWPF